MKGIPAHGIVGARLIEAAATEVRQVATLVSQALREKTGEYWDLEALYPDRVIVNARGRMMAYPFTLNADNTVTLGTFTAG